MAVLKGIKEKVHSPLYDSLFVRPRRQLREIESSNVLKFFINVQRKTKLETNMQSASLLPHWNTFEARALRVVISDLPVSFPEEVEKCLREPNGSANGTGSSTLTRCLDDLSVLIEDGRPEPTEQLVSIAQERVNTLNNAVEEAGTILADLEGCLGLLRLVYDPQKMGRTLELQRDLRSIRYDLATVIRRTRIQLTKPKEMSRFADTIDALGDTSEEEDLLRQIKEVTSCLNAFVRLGGPITRIKDTSLAEVQACVSTVENLIQTEPARIERLGRVKACLMEAQANLDQLKMELGQTQAAAIRKCLNEALSNQLLIPLDEQLFGNGPEILAKLIYNSVTTLFVGEKVMIQMPTWFFPAGAGPYSEDGKGVTHGLPMPQATFHFAEPVFIDTQQNFRVEIEIPEAGTLCELQRIYGPFFIWVVLDGYMQRDVQ